ncbi:ABC transporter permease [Actinokineospora soli]|uniref:ABC transporter permease n=1 Tax=Actinokineospora soli TaxID=1048753 RepID=A0ABW2TMD3_9PSEU
MLGCAFMGFATSFREVVKERAILQRERAIGLSPGAYLGSKMAVLGLIGALQAVVFCVLGTLGTPPPDDPVVLGAGLLEVAVALVAVTASIMALGLLVSALITNADRGMPILVVVLLLQLVLCGSLFPVEGRAVVEQLSWLMPARWGYAMGVNTAGLPGGDVDPLWEHAAGPWLLGLGVQLALVAVFAAAARYALRARRPTRR